MIDPTIPRLPKVTGADVELGNFVLGVPLVDTCAVACRALLAEIEGISYGNSRYGVYRGESGRGSGGETWHDHRAPVKEEWNPQDWGRKFLASNGGCAYIDLDHLELCLPEVTSALDHVAAWHAMLRIARRAMLAANARLEEGRAIQVLVNNFDGHGHSYGSHLNFLVTRRAWQNIFGRKLHYMAWLASFQVSSIVMTGQGRVGSDNNAPHVPFQISQRADFLETLTGPQTTFNRPIINARDEDLCGGWRRSAGDAGPARLHVIFFDNTLAHRSTLLKVGAMQLVLAMLEAESVDTDLILDDPLAALASYSHDPSLRTAARLASGGETTAVDLQLRFLESAGRFSALGGFDGIVPGAGEIIDIWSDTLSCLKRADWLNLASKLDWVMKWMVLQRAIDQRPELAWDSPVIRHLDQVYASLGDDGLYWNLEASGRAEMLVPEEAILRFTTEPPKDTRAWTRAMLLRAADPGSVDRVDWDSISFRLRSGGYWPSYRQIDMHHPLALTAAHCGPIFAGERDFTRILDALETQNTGGHVEAGCSAAN